MKRFAVAYADLYDNELTITIERSDTWMNAIRQRYTNDVLHSIKNHQDDEYKEIRIKSATTWLDEIMNEDIEQVKQYFFDCDSLIDVIELE